MRLALTATLVITATVSAGQQPEGSIGAYPVPPVVKMSGECPGYVIASGVVESADHEIESGYGNVNEFAFAMRPQSPFYLRVVELRGQPVEVIFRPIKPRTLERVR